MGYPMAFSAMQKCRQRGQKHLSTIAATSIVAGGSLLPIFPAAATTTCTAADLNQLRAHALDVDCDIINVTQNISFSEGNNGIVVTHDVLIQGSVTIDSNYFGEIFLITHDYDGTVYAGDINNNNALDVTFKNLTLREGIASSNNYFSYSTQGGAVSQTDNSLPINLKLDSVDFIDNLAEVSGGAVYIREGYIEVTNASTFTGNEAGSGGAIHIFDGTKLNNFLPGYFPTADTSGLLISDGSVFTDNTASVYGGGAILAQTGVVMTGEATFYQNVANLQGGAIASISTYIGTSADVVFDNNYAGTYGGAIGLFDLGVGIIEDQTLLWVQGDATFTDNQAGAGGAVAVWALFALSESHVVFERNRANYGNGGAIATFGVVFGVYRDFDQAAESRAEFTNNFAAQDGGAIWSTVLFSDQDNSLSFIGNQSGNNGGAISTYGLGAPYQISNAYFGQNVANNNGGAIYSTRRVMVENSTFHSNSAGEEGGALFANGNDSQVMLSTFVNNQANGVGVETPGQSIYTGGTIKLFGNIFADLASDEAQLGKGLGGGVPELIDLGGNLSTSQTDATELVHATSRIVSYSDLTLAAAPSIDLDYPTAAKTIQISTDSAAADILNLAELEESIAQLSLAGNVLPTRDQRGSARTLRYDSGAYEAGENTYRSITPIINVLPRVILPAAPNRVVVLRAGKSALKIEWTLPTSAGSGKITGYEIYRNGKKIATVSSSKRSYRDAGLDVNQSYTYRIVTIATQGKSIKSVNSQSIFPRMQFRVK